MLQKGKASVTQSVADFMPDEFELAFTPPVQPDDIFQCGLKRVSVNDVPRPAVLGKCVKEELVMIAQKDTSVH